MNVLHFINNLNREGAQVMVSNLVTAASNGQVNYFVCVRQPGGALVSSLREQGICVVEPPQYYGFKSVLKSVKFLKRVCRENDIQLIHAHMADATFLGWLVARHLQLPLVISHHGDDILLNCHIVCRSIYYILLNFSVRYASMNIAVSNSVAKRIRELLFIGGEKVQIISNGVHIPTISQVEKRRGALCKQSLTLVTVGRLVPLKGHSQLIHAVSKLVSHFPQISLYIVGGGEMDKELKQLAKDEKVEQHIKFTGAVDDVSVYLAKADLFVSSSRAEGMPVSILEAMAWQLPVVASNIPGNVSVVKHSKTGFLYELNNVQDLVDCIVSVMGNVELARSVAIRARVMVEKKYSAEVCERQHQALYLKNFKQGK